MEKIFDQLLTSTITGELVYVVNIGGYVKYFKNWSSVARFMKKMGYEYSTDGYGGWLKTKNSDDEVWLNAKFKKS